MNLLDAGLSAWIAFHASLGVNLQASLLPPALAEEIESVERVIGHALPEDLRKLYLFANGQLDPFDVPFVGNYAPMFGRYRFLSLSQALREYQRLYDQYKADRQWHNDSALAGSGAPIVWAVRTGDPVESSGWNPDWFVFASDQINYFSVDLSPPPGGHKGQVVSHGPDRWELRVLAPSISDLLSQASTRLDPELAGNFGQDRLIAGEGTQDWSYLEFTMDWREQVPTAENQGSPDGESHDAWNSSREEYVDQFLHWLNDKSRVVGPVVQKSWNSDELAALREWMYISFSLGPSALFTKPIPDALIPPYTHLDYLMQLEQNMMLPADYISETLSVSRHQAYALVHRFQWVTDRWSQQEYEQAQAILRKFNQ